MARYVVLYFEDNHAAEVFVGSKICYEPPNTGQIETLHNKPVALVPAPTLFCQGCKGGKTGTGWFRGKKYGWWVCGACGKPSKQWGMSYSAVLSSGTNLIEDADHAPALPGWEQTREG